MNARKFFPDLYDVFWLGMKIGGMLAVTLILLRAAL